MDNRTQQLESIGVDIEPTLRRFCNDEDLLVEMLQEFCLEGHDVKLSQALQSDDCKALEHAAHTAKGTSANLGLNELSDACNAVVQAVRKNDLSDIGGMTSRAIRCYSSVCSSVAALG